MKLLESKYRCLDLFYASVDRDMAIDRFHEYEESFEEVFVYIIPELSDLEKAVWCLTMVIRFARSGMLLVKNASLEESTMEALDFLKTADWESFDLNDEDKKQLRADMREVLSYLDWLEEKRNAKESKDNEIAQTQRGSKTERCLFRISFCRKNVSDKDIVELMKKIMFFRPTSFTPNRKGIKRLNKDTYFDYLEECLKKHNEEHYSVESNSTNSRRGHVVLWTYPATDIAVLSYFINDREFELISETEKIVSEFIKEHTIISAVIRTWSEHEYNDTYYVDTAKKLHPELPEIKTVGYEPDPNPDPEQFAAHTHEYGGIWFGCCYEMWFGRDYDKYIPTEKLKTFKECKLNETPDNDTIHIILYDSPDEFSTPKSVERAWAFRKHTDCDHAAEVWKKRVNVLANEAGHFTYEIKQGRFPHGGIRLLLTYLDENGNHVNKCDAAKVHIYECGTDGKHVFEETIDIAEYDRRERERRKNDEQSAIAENN